MHKYLVELAIEDSYSWEFPLRERARVILAYTPDEAADILMRINNYTHPKNMIHANYNDLNAEVWQYVDIATSIIISVERLP